MAKQTGFIETWRTSATNEIMTSTSMLNARQAAKRAWLRRKGNILHGRMLGYLFFSLFSSLFAISNVPCTYPGVKDWKKYNKIHRVSVLHQLRADCTWHRTNLHLYVLPLSQQNQTYLTSFQNNFHYSKTGNRALADFASENEFSTFET